jgi:hypothetical protein
MKFVLFVVFVGQDAFLPSVAPPRPRWLSPDSLRMRWSIP